MKTYDIGLDALGFDLGDIAQFFPAVAVVKKIVDSQATPATSATPATTPTSVSPGTSAAKTPLATPSPTVTTTQPDVRAAVREALAQEKAAASSQRILYGVLTVGGVAIVGGAFYFMRRK